jgi:hypothetical protein
MEGEARQILDRRETFPLWSRKECGARAPSRSHSPLTNKAIERSISRGQQV